MLNYCCFTSSFSQSLSAACAYVPAGLAPVKLQRDSNTFFVVFLNLSVVTTPVALPFSCAQANRLETLFSATCDPSYGTEIFTWILHLKCPPAHFIWYHFCIRYANIRYAPAGQRSLQASPLRSPPLSHSFPSPGSSYFSFHFDWQALLDARRYDD